MRGFLISANIFVPLMGYQFLNGSIGRF